MGRTSTAVVWLLTRGAVLWLFFGRESWVTGDVAYFAASLDQLPERGLASTLVEYPLPGVALVALPWLITELTGHSGLYSEVVLALALLTDAAFTVLLHRFSGTGRAGATWVWLLAVPLLGATTYARFDLVPGVLAGVALLLVVVHPRLAAAAGAVATGLKLWPALLLPALSSRTRERRPVVVVVTGVGVALTVACLALAGWGRLVSPLTWQADRGLQIESVPATPVMLGWGFGPGDFVVAYSDYNAFEITGPGVPLLLAASRVLTAVMVTGLVALWVRAWRRGTTLTPDAVVWACLAAVSAFLVTAKVLSPQYLLWLLPPTAAGLAVVTTRRGLHRLRRWAAVLLVATGATHLVFPLSYGGLTTHDPGSFWVTLLLAARNLMLVWLAVHAAGEAWWHVGRRVGPQRGSELDRQPPGPDGSDARILR